MKVPARTIELPGGLRCPAYDVAQAPWLAHVVKHPLGLDAVAGRPPGTPWNREGWGTLTPPVIDAAERDRLARNIAGLEVDGSRCAIPEVRGERGASDPDRLACYVCPRTLASQCAWVLDDVSKAYASVTTSLVEAFDAASSVSVPRAQMFKVLARKLSRYDAWASLSLLSVGLDARQGSRQIARISRADGVRAEFYLSLGEFRWRTTWRHPPVNHAQAMSFLLDFATPAPPSASLSENCLVERLWWETHAL